ncbi:hypothetical protein NCAST_08_02340 [Nocardia asteroides NBRC 15531]|uniref:Uncharacterized protein n=1 Tax=Nocardia asteroides NBRC 15531 TaxID=1110697 RepID=U5E5J7_NOCAS|nr:hypothetical protein NCAST_08_02340 [Nocardia asteroides NBRC 15531]SFM96214.1 hypothetical protein SAMN05444423_105141 [Nocardia asteroides]VEG34915.1 Uncharacterised protein [Nocardia asteroides]
MGTVLAVLGAALALAIGALLAGYAVVLVVYWIELHRRPSPAPTPDGAAATRSPAARRSRPGPAR